jgi:hypothetical protein
MESNYIYLLKEREFIKTNEDIYKIGRTKKPNHQRFNQYPMGSILLFQMICDDCHHMEQHLIKLFKENFVLRKDYGNEYFEGDHRNMMQFIYTAITESNNTELIPIQIGRKEEGVIKCKKKTTHARLVNSFLKECVEHSSQPRHFLVAFDLFHHFLKFEQDNYVEKSLIKRNDFQKHVISRLGSLEGHQKGWRGYKLKMPEENDVPIYKYRIGVFVEECIEETNLSKDKMMVFDLFQRFFSIRKRNPY